MYQISRAREIVLYLIYRRKDHLSETFEFKKNKLIVSKNFKIKSFYRLIFIIRTIS